MRNRKGMSLITLILMSFIIILLAATIIMMLVVAINKNRIHIENNPTHIDEILKY